MTPFFGFKYSKAIHDIVSTPAGKFGCKLAGKSAPQLAVAIENNARSAVPLWKRTGHSPKQAAIVAVGLAIENYRASEKKEPMNGAVSVALRRALAEIAQTDGHADFVAEVLSWCDEQENGRGLMQGDTSTGGQR
jgi:uracil-DNA glycosylase